MPTENIVGIQWSESLRKLLKSRINLLILSWGLTLKAIWRIGEGIYLQ